MQPPKNTSMVKLRQYHRDPLDPLDLRVQKVSRDLLGRKALLDQRVLSERRGRRASRGLQARLERLVRLVPPAQQERQAQWGHKAPREQLERASTSRDRFPLRVIFLPGQNQVMPGSSRALVICGPGMGPNGSTLVRFRVQQARWVLLALRVFKGYPVQLVQKVQQESKVLRV
jgi:hypothetical protein